MSTTANVSDFQQGNTPTAHATQPFLWSVRRELWEYRSAYVAPLIVAALAVMGFLISGRHVGTNIRAAELLGPMQLQMAIERPYDFVALFLMGIVFLISIFYSIEALQGERRDRSILFWKSLPLSDMTIVLSKISVPVVILPLIAVVLTVVTHVIMLLLNLAIAQAGGVGAATVWNNISLWRMWLMMLYHMLALHGLWMAPLYAWLLLVSAWARRAAFLWAVLPLAAIGVVEKLAFNTQHFANWIFYRFGGAPGANAYPGNHMAVHEWGRLSLGQFLLDPGLWTGLIAAGLFLFVAARIRRSRGPI